MLWCGVDVNAALQRKKNGVCAGKVREIVLFGGTTEGKRLVEYMEQGGIACYVCVATEYGKEVLPTQMKYCRVLVGRMDQCSMEAFLRDNHIRLVLDATHPYAVEVTRNITRACEKEDIDCVRVGREETSKIDGAVYVSSAQEAADYLNGQQGHALLTTGSKELKCFQTVTGYRDRLYARILPMEQAVQAARECGFREDHLIYGRGPFSVEQNVKMIQDSRARYVVTKDTGAEGGLPEKAEAARQTGIRLLVIRRPVEETDMTVDEACAFLKENMGKPQEQKE